jgi:serine/threonine-protein kinase
VFLVMELLEGETLEARCQRKGGKLPAGEVLSIASQLLDVLAAAHAKDIVHRDVKPENLFLTKTSALKVLDFGIARVRELSQRSGATRGGDTIGTPNYMPPEQARGRWDELDARSDLWAVGATMFALLTGRCVHEAETVPEVLLAAMTKTAPPVRTVVPQLPEPVAAVVDRALAFDRVARWPDARAMQEAVTASYASLEAGDSAPALPRVSIPDREEAATPPDVPSRPATITTGRAVTQSVEEAPRPPTGTPGRRRTIAIAAGAAAAVVVVALAVVAVRSSGVSDAERKAPGAGPQAAASVTETAPPAAAAASTPPPEASASLDEPLVRAEDLPTAPPPAAPTAPSTRPAAVRPAPSFVPWSAPQATPARNPLDRRH